MDVYGIQAEAFEQLLKYAQVYGINTVLVFVLLVIVVIQFRSFQKTVKEINEANAKVQAKMQEAITNNTIAIAELSAYIKGRNMKDE